MESNQPSNSTIESLIEGLAVHMVKTHDGCSFLSGKQLQLEVNELLIDCGGRIALQDMSTLLGVGVEVLEPYIHTVCTETETQIVNGQVLTQAYLRELIDEISILVQEQGLVTLQDLSESFGLPVDFFRNFLTKSEASLPRGCSWNNSTLQTKAYTTRQEFRVRGIMRAISKPTPVGQLASKYSVDEVRMKAIIDDLIKTEQIDGKMAKGMYTPTAFSRTQVQAVKHYFSEHGFVEQDKLSKLDMTLKKFFSQHVEGKEPVLFSGFALSSDLYRVIEDKITDTVRSAGFLNLTEILPDCFRTREQTMELIEKVDQACRLMPDGDYLCSSKFLQKCLESLIKPSEEEALKMIKKGQRPEKILKILAEQNQKPTSKGKRKSKQEQDTVPSDHLSTELLLRVCPFQQTQIAAILAKPPIDEELCPSLAEFLVEPVAKQFWHILSECDERSSTRANAKDNANHEQQAEQLFQSLKFVLKQMDNIKQKVTYEQFQSMVNPVKAHLCKTVATPLLNKLFLIQAFHNGVSLEKLSLSSDQHSQPTCSTLQDRQLLTKEFTAHVKDILGSLTQLVQDRNLDAFMTNLSEETKNLAARLGKVGAIDKKVERAIKTELMERAQLAVETFTKSKDLSVISCRDAFNESLNLLLLRNNCYLGFSDGNSEEWSVRIRVNVLKLHADDSRSRLAQDAVELLYSSSPDANVFTNVQEMISQLTAEPE